MGYSRKNPNGTEDIGSYFFNETLECLGLSLYPWKFQRKQSFTSSPQENPENCITRIGNSKTKEQDPWKFHMIFSLSPLENQLFF